MSSGNLFLYYLEDWDAENAREAFAEGDGTSFGWCGRSRGRMLDNVMINARQLIERGIYEQALLTAFTGCKHNNRNISNANIKRLFDMADRRKLRLASAELPNGEIEVFRGVSGRGPARRVRGLSWTRSLDVACWFALRFGGDDPAVYAATVTPLEIYACIEDSEREVIVQPARYSRLTLTLEDLGSGRDRELAARNQKNGVAA